MSSLKTVFVPLKATAVPALIATKRAIAEATLAKDRWRRMPRMGPPRLSLGQPYPGPAGEVWSAHWAERGAALSPPPGLRPQPGTEINKLARALDRRRISLCVEGGTHPAA